LANRIDLPSLRAAAEESVLDITGDEVVDFQRRVVADDLPWQYIRDQKQSLRRRLKGYERLPRYRATPKRMTLRFRSSTLGRKVRAGIPQRTLTAPAPVVAAVGADGSGKSRLTHDLAEWLGWKLRVRHIYFGQPKGGLIWKLLGKPGSIARRKGSDLGPIARRVDSAKWLWLARRRRRLAVDAAQIANQGVVVIGERYPLPEFETMAAPMDGPRLQGSGSSLARRELGEYREIPTPDLLIVLHTDLETLRERKLDLGVEEHTAKVAAVQALSPGPGRIIIDAGPPYERVLQEAKRAVWEAIVGSR
jgi:thymidylate kinase